MMSPEMRARNAATILGLTALGIGVDPMMGLGRPRKAPEATPCVVCGQPQFETNGFCSAECFKSHKTKNKAPVMPTRRKKSKSKRKK
jgi:hypothetical protein